MKFFIQLKPEDTLKEKFNAIDAKAITVLDLSFGSIGQRNHEELINEFARIEKYPIHTMSLSNNNLNQQKDLLKNLFAKLPTELRYLSLYKNLLGLMTLENLLPAILSLSRNLYSLNISQNELGKLATQDIIQVFQALPPVKVLVVSDPTLFDKTEQEIEQIFTALPATLEEINLSCIYSPNLTVRKFVAALQSIAEKAPYLVRVNLSYNQLNTFNSHGINEIIKALPASLTHLELCHNNLINIDLSSTFPLLPDNLIHLDLDSNSNDQVDANFLDQISTQLVTGLSQTKPKLTSLSLALNNLNLLSDPQLLSIIKGLPVKLEHVNLSHDELGSKAAKIIQALKPNVTRVNLSCNILDPYAVLKVVPNFISHLDLSHNYSPILEKLEEGFESKLRSLSLASTKLEQLTTLQLIILFKGLPELTTLDLSNNRYLFANRSVADLSAIFAAFSQQLEVLNLSGTGLDSYSNQDLKKLKLAQLKKVYLRLSELVIDKKRQALEELFPNAEIIITTNEGKPCFSPFTAPIQSANKHIAVGLKKVQCPSLFNLCGHFVAKHNSINEEDKILLPKELQEHVDQFIKICV